VKQSILVVSYKYITNFEEFLNSKIGENLMDMNLPLQNEKLWTKNYIAMVILSFFLSVSLNMTGTVTPLFVQHLGGDLSIVGVVVAFFTVAALIFRPYFGVLLDKKGRKLTIIVGGLIFSAATLAHGIAFSILALFVLRFLQGMGFSAHSTASGTVISDIIPTARLTEGMGFFGISHTLGMALGPFLGLELVELAGFNLVFIFAAVLGAISIVITSSLKLKSDLDRVKFHKSKAQAMEKRTGSPLDSLFEKTAIAPSVVLLFVAFSLATVTFLPVLAVSRGIGDVGIFFTIFALVQLITRPLTGKVADKYGFSYVMLPGLVFIAVSMILLAFAADITEFVIAGVFYGIGFGSAQPTLNAIMIRLCPPARRGVGTATFFSSMDIGIGVGAVVWGIISQAAGFTFVFLGAAVCIISSVLIYIFWLEKLLSVKAGSNVAL